MALRAVLGASAMSHDPNLPTIVVEKNGLIVTGVLIDGVRLPATVDVSVLCPLGGPCKVVVSFIGNVELREVER